MLFSGSAHHIPVHSSLIPAHFIIFRYHSSSFCFILVSFRLVPPYSGTFHSVPVFSNDPSDSASLRYHSGSFRYIPVPFLSIPFHSGVLLPRSSIFRSVPFLCLVTPFYLFADETKVIYAGKNLKYIGDFFNVTLTPLLY